MYSRFLSEAGADNIDQYSIIPIGAVGYGNVKTTYSWIPDGKGGQVLVFENAITNLDKMYTVNIASSFARALVKCLESETHNINTNAHDLVMELRSLQRNFGLARNIIDILFNGSTRREHVYDLEQEIGKSRREILTLEKHRNRLEAIALSSQ